MADGALVDRLFFLYKATRMKDWSFQAGLAILGLSFATSIPGPGTLAICAVMVSLYLSNGYLVNNLSDMDIDMPVKNAFHAGKHKAAGTALVLLTGSALVILALYSGIMMTMLSLMGFIISFAYSCSPLRLKRHILPRLLLNSAGFSILFMMGLYLGGLSREGLLMLPVIFLMIVPFEVIHIEHDRKDDSKLFTSDIRTGRLLSDLSVSLALVWLMAFNSLIGLMPSLLTSFLLAMLFISSQVSLPERRSLKALAGAYGLSLVIILQVARWL